MSDSRKGRGLDCRSAAEAIHGLIDSEIIAATLKQRFAEHLSRCERCRGLQADLLAIRQTLRATPELELPDRALQQVWERTTRAEPSPAAGRRWPALAAAAAIVALALLGLWPRGGPVPEGPSPEQLEQAARQARMVLRLTADALQRSERAALRDVLSEEVAPALRRVPIAWPEKNANQRRGS